LSRWMPEPSYWRLWTQPFAAGSLSVRGFLVIISFVDRARQPPKTGQAKMIAYNSSQIWTPIARTWGLILGIRGLSMPECGRYQST
jgi:hypothetical protein